MGYGSPAEKLRARRRFGYLALLMFSGALLFATPSGGRKEEPLAETPKPVDHRRRRLLKIAAALGIGGAGAYALTKSPLLGAASRAASAPEPPSGVYMGLTAGGQAAQFPQVSSLPSAASAGAMTYDATKGRLYVMDGILGQWRREGTGAQPRTVVTPYGISVGTSTEYNDGWGPCGPDTPDNTGTVGMQYAVNQGVNQPVVVTIEVLAGTFNPTGTVTLPNSLNYVTVYYDGPTINIPSGTPLWTFDDGYLWHYGSATFNGAGAGSNTFVVSSAASTTLWVDGAFTLTNMGGNHWAYNLFEPGTTFFRGLWTATSGLIYIDAAKGYVEIVQCNGAITSSTNLPSGAGIIEIGSNQSASTFTFGTYVHDIFIDGGGVVPATPVVIGPNTNVADANYVVVSNIMVKNTEGGADGVDILRCTYVQVSNVFFASTNDGLSILASESNVVGLWAYSCRAQGLAIGDPSVQTENLTWISASGIHVRDCATSQTSNTAACTGIGIATTTGYTVAHVTITGGESVAVAGSGVQSYGFAISGTSTSDVYVIGVRLGGLTAPFYSGGQAFAQFFLNCPGANNLGVVTSPFGNNAHLGVYGGGDASPSASGSASTTYTVCFTPIMLSVSGGSGLSITVKDANANTILSGAASLAQLYMQIGWTINFGAFTGSPTFVVVGC